MKKTFIGWIKEMKPLPMVDQKEWMQTWVKNYLAEFDRLRAKLIK
jgi:hypothetical protein